MPGSSVPSTARLGNQYLSLGALFKSSAGLVALVDRFPANPMATPSPPHIIGGTSLAGSLGYGQPVEIEFVMPGVGSVPAADVGVVGTGATLTLTLPGSHRVMLASDTGSVGCHNLQFGTLAAVPGPAALLLLLAGLGALGLRAKRDRPRRRPRRPQSCLRALGGWPSGPSNAPQCGLY